jgi:hypothetical protein
VVGVKFQVISQIAECKYKLKGSGKSPFAFATPFSLRFRAFYRNPGWTKIHTVGVLVDHGAKLASRAASDNIQKPDHVNII